MFWILPLLVLLAASANADVVRKQQTTAEFWGANEATTTFSIAGDRSADESVTKWTRGFMKTATRGKPTESKTIVRLDKQVIWTLDPKKKTYTEMTFAEFREMLEKGMAEMKEESEEGEDTATVGEDMYEWTVEDLSEPEPKRIGSYTCRNVHLVATGVNKEEANDQVVITMDTWNSEEVPGRDEIAEFYRKYAAALGLDEWALTPGLLQAATAYRQQFAALYDAFKKAPGESVQSLIEIKRHALKGKSLGKLASQAAQEELTSKLPFGGGKKKKKEEAPEWVWKVRFRSTGELIEASTNPVEAATFEIPAGFKKKDK
ncbi:hypothetical protein KKH27_02435 [bacterium]|nr:hypothetical protein [bacterium]MBU1984671.1 hypothetical protein [bacterium]